MGGRQRSWAWGPAAGALLVVATTLSMALGVLAGIPLLDGLAPPAAYRWVHPPTELRSGNKAPSSLSARVPLTVTGSVGDFLGTDDNQVTIGIPAGAFPPAPGQTGLDVAVLALDPAAAPAPPPGLAIQGNAYRISVASVPSGTTVTATQPVDVTLRYPVDATQVILWTGTEWEPLPTTLESAALAVDATTTRFGLFAAAGAGGVSGPRRTPAWAYVAAGLALLAAAVPTLASRRRRAQAPPPRRTRGPR